MIGIHKIENAESVLAALDELLSANGEGMLTFDESGSVSFSTRLADEMLDIDCAVSQGKIRATVSSLGGKTVLLADTLSSAEPQIYSVRARDGKERLIWVSALPARRALMVRDISENNKSSEQNLLDVAAHDLRGGMVPAKTYVQMLLSSVFGQLNEKQTEAAKVIDANLQKQEDRIASVLDMIKAEQNRLELQIESASLIDIVRAAAASVERDCRKKQVELVLDLDPSAALIDADVRRLQRVLSNLLARCLKHSQPQQKMGIELRYLVSGKARLRLWDTGSGSSVQDLDTLLQSSRRQAEKRLAAGSAPNIDLGAVFDIIQGHRGELKVQTEHGAGTTYLLYLPVRRRDKTTGFSAESAAEKASLLLAGVAQAQRDQILEEATKRKICLNEADTGLHALSLARTRHFPLVILGEKEPDRARIFAAIRAQRPEDPQSICEIRSGVNGHAQSLDENDPDAAIIWDPQSLDCGMMLEAMLKNIRNHRTSPRLTIHEPEKGREVEDHSRR